MAKLAMIVKTKCQAGKRDEVRRLWDEHLKERALANEAQEVIFYCYDNQNENVFYLFEIYSSPQAVEESSKAPWFWDYMKAVGTLLDGQPEVMTSTPVYTKGGSI